MLSQGKKIEMVTFSGEIIDEVEYRQNICLESVSSDLHYCCVGNFNKTNEL
jgi:hypothetical protein